MTGLIKCYCCSAEYRRTQWVTVDYDGGTSGLYTIHGKIPMSQCPICRTEELDQEDLRIAKEMRENTGAM